MKHLLVLIVIGFCNAFCLAEEPQLQVEHLPGANIHVWIPGDATDRLIDGRDWYTGNEWLYIAVSIDELRIVKNDLNKGGWSWMQAQEEDHTLVTVWYQGRHEPFFALRGDLFQKLQPKFKGVHKNKRPWQITRDPSDDPK